MENYLPFFMEKYLPFTAFGITTMWAAIFADVGVTIIAVLNAFRALNVKNL